MRNAELALSTRRDTRRLARILARHVGVGDLVVLSGDLGTGKTFFTRAVLRALGVPESIPVTSPSFALVHDYAARIPVIHADLYRIGHPDELDLLGLRDTRGHALVIVEWGAPYAQQLGGATLELTLRIAPRGRVALLRGDPAASDRVFEPLAREIGLLRSP